MARVKFDFGIDLGTTNSAIAVMNNGEVSIIKSDRQMKDTTPSCVQFNKKGQIRVGDEALFTYQQDLELELSQGLTRDSKNAYLEFKRTMGTDKKYYSSNMDREYSSEELSAEVLKKLKSYVKEENINAAVVTVPNQFRQNQVDATQRAAELAGLGCCELLQEPIAASMAYGLSTDNMQGYWIVFDFGGGTFDVALMKVDEGIMKVVDTDGDNHLGGKDIDLAVVDKILIPWIEETYSVDELLADEKRARLLRDVMKAYAEAIKIALSSRDEVDDYGSDDPLAEDDEGKDIELNIKVGLSDYEQAISPIFSQAIEITKSLLARNKLTSHDIASILLVGGPTFSQTLRRMLREEFGDIVDTSIDPMTSVARGAALFAATRTIPADLQKRDTAKVQLLLKYPETTVETEESLGIRIERSKTEGEIPDVVGVEIIRSDKGWSSAKAQIEDADIIEIQLVPGKPNSFEVLVTDEQGNQLPCEPHSFTIIQGLQAAKATLPRSICIDSVIAGTGKTRLVALEGLEKNSSLPAKGKGTFKTQKEIRPGNADDVLRIPIIEGNPGERSNYNEKAGIVVCNGEHISEYLPEGSDVELTVAKDSSGLITLSAFFPHIDETLEIVVKEVHDTEQKEYDASDLAQEIQKAQHACALVEHADSDQLQEQLKDLAQKLEARSDYETKLSIQEHLNRILKDLDRLEGDAAWPEAERVMDAALEHLVETNEQFGDQKSAAVIKQIRSKAEEIRQRQDIGLATSLTEDIGTFQFSLIRNQTGLWIGYVKGFDDDFDSHQWSDPNAARQLINQAKQIIATQPSREKIEAIVIQLFNLLPNKEMPIAGDADRDLLLK